MEDNLPPPPVILDQKTKKPPFEVAHGVVWIDSEYGYDEALRMLNNVDD